MHQWVAELHAWSPLQRVVIIHGTSFNARQRKHVVRVLCRDDRPGNVLITSYSTLALKPEIFVDCDWHYVVLDEGERCILRRSFQKERPSGHKIRNPHARVTRAAKELCTPHRLLLTGSPMQNNLRELWSLIDFVAPGRLGALQVRDFETPLLLCFNSSHRHSWPNSACRSHRAAMQTRTTCKCAPRTSVRASYATQSRQSCCGA